jgi:regulator of replication initiation timing
MELIKIENEIAILNGEVSKQIAEFERQVKEIKEREDELKASILKEMEANNIIKLETEDLMINYIAPSERETLDSKKLREEQPVLYDEYVKFSPVKASIRLKVK